MGIVIQGGPVHRKALHRVADISFARHVIACACGELVRVRPDRDEPKVSVEQRLADKFRLHRTPVSGEERDGQRA